MKELSKIFDISGLNNVLDENTHGLFPDVIEVKYVVNEDIFSVLTKKELSECEKNEVIDHFCIPDSATVKFKKQSV